MSSRCEPRHGDGWVLYNIVLGRGCALSRRLRMPTFGPEEIMTGFRNSGPLCSTTHPPVDDGTAMPSSAAADDITRARTLIHEESHFVTAGGTDDVQSTFPGDPRKPGGRRCTATPRPLDWACSAASDAKVGFFIERHDPADHPLDLDWAAHFPTVSKQRLRRGWSVSSMTAHLSTPRCF